MEDFKVQRNYKDTLFRRLFQEKDALLSLYNALNGSNYDNPDDLTINTLENTIYLGMKNDVSFLLDDYLNLYEAQSTWNPNMPLRDFMFQLLAALFFTTEKRIKKTGKSSGFPILSSSHLIRNLRWNVWSHA